MISAVHSALYDFFSQFGVPVYLSGRVADDATFPYLTITVENDAAFEETYLTCFDWHQAKNDGTNVNTERETLMNQIAAAIPESGTTLTLPDDAGYLILNRNTSFQTYYDDPTDKTVIGGRTSYLVRFYTL